MLKQHTHEYVTPPVTFGSSVPVLTLVRAASQSDHQSMNT